jgi:hypothetical protein
MKLYWGPHTCTIGIHILLEEIGKPYETEKLDLSGGATLTHRPSCPSTRRGKFRR